MKNDSEIVQWFVVHHKEGSFSEWGHSKELVQARYPGSTVESQEEFEAWALPNQT